MFDAGGTLVLQHPDLMAERLGMSIDAEAAFHAHYLTMADFARRRTAGEPITWDWWLEQYFLRLGHSAPAAAGGLIDRGFGLWSWALPGVLDAIRRLRAAGVRTSVVSNSDGSVADSLAAAGFDGCFEDIVDSAVVGCAKPDPRIFEIACERIGVLPGEVWYVGDSIFHDVGGAVAAGLGGAWLIDPLDLHTGHPHRIRSVAELPGLLEI